MQNKQPLNPKSSNLKPKNIAIKVQNLTKTYKLYKEPIDRLKEALNPFKKSYHNDFYALKDVSFEINRSETVGIIGRNGSGKSTLLKIITSVLMPSGGQVKVNGKISAILELGAGFNPELSGLENIYLNMSINGITKQETDNKIDEILDFAEIGDFVYQPLKTYSSGMKARLAFALAINIEPDILIVDEALAVGDAAFQRKCFAKMEQIREKGATILFVSHSEANIVSLCNRAIWLSNGEKIIEGEPKLVTGLYMKNSQKKQINKAEIEKELIKLIKKTKEKNIKQKKNNSKLEIRNSKSMFTEEFYDPSLKPKSTIYYEKKGVEINDAKIVTLDGKKVNVLVQGGKYIYSYNIYCHTDLNKIQFGMLIKTKNGVDLTGYAYPSKTSYISVDKGIHKISFLFHCLFNAGEYFFNASARGIIDNEIIIFDRVIDIYCIRVAKVSDKSTSKLNLIIKGEIDG